MVCSQAENGASWSFQQTGYPPHRKRSFCIPLYVAELRPSLKKDPSNTCSPLCNEALQSCGVLFFSFSSSSGVSYFTKEEIELEG